MLTGARGRIRRSLMFVLDARGRLLMATLGFAGCALPSYDRALWARSWLDSWSGTGHVAIGMHGQGFDLQLTQYDERGWRAAFYTTSMEHSPTSATGTAWEPKPWHAVQRAAWEALETLRLYIGRVQPILEKGGAPASAHRLRSEVCSS